MSAPIGHPDRHFFIARSVARVMGISLSMAMRDGALDPDSYAEMIERCQRCPLVKDCQEWLARQTSITQTPPPGCRIGATLSALRR